jgi:hypothetical protein
LKAGETVYEKSREIGRIIMLEIGQNLHRKACCSDREIARKAMRDLLLVNMTMLAVGRYGEAGLSSWNASYWCGEYHCIVFQWPELKTAEGNELFCFYK